MRVLITGIDGFVAYHLCKLLISQGDEVYGTTINNNYDNENKIPFYNMNLLDKDNVMDVITKVKPECIYHLAGQSAVGLSWQNPVLTMDINVNGTINLLEAVRKLDDENNESNNTNHNNNKQNNILNNNNKLNSYNSTLLKKCRVLIIGSSDQYGPVTPEMCPIKESQTLNPVSPYGISKCTQEQMAQLYSNAYNMDIVMVRAFNHIGPRQGKNFVVADFASKIAEIEKGIEPILKVGNLEAKRDFTDVRDIVKGYKLLMEKGHKGEIYNIGSGKEISILDILNRLVKLSTKNIEVIIDKDKLRPIDVPLVKCDNSKIKEHIGWELEQDIEKTLEDTLNHWRKIV